MNYHQRIIKGLVKFENRRDINHAIHIDNIVKKPAQRDDNPSNADESTEIYR